MCEQANSEHVVNMHDQSMWYLHLQINQQRVRMIIGGDYLLNVRWEVPPQPLKRDNPNYLGSRSSSLAGITYQISTRNASGSETLLYHSTQVTYLLDVEVSLQTFHTL